MYFLKRCIQYSDTLDSEICYLTHVYHRQTMGGVPMTTGIPFISSRVTLLLNRLMKFSFPDTSMITLLTRSYSTIQCDIISLSRFTKNYDPSVIWIVNTIQQMGTTLWWPRHKNTEFKRYLHTQKSCSDWYLICLIKLAFFSREFWHESYWINNWSHMYLKPLSGACPTIHLFLFEHDSYLQHMHDKYH